MSELYDIFRRHPRISTDTRRIEPGSVFFALHGATFDGNRFAADALSKGAAYAVVDDPAAVIGDRTVLVGDTLEALQELAREHRRELAIPILAISGSNGKTTTKELVSRVLAERFEVYATHGNLNNHIGVPLTLLAMTRDTEFGVVEMGASACGEIALLASVAEPNYGILTNIGRAHLEGFGGPEGIRRGKGELLDKLCGKTFAIGPHAFYQVNHDQCERLYALAGDFAGLTGDQVLLDLYCGVGTIGLTLADRCRRLIGVEVVPQAVENARENARRNGIENAEFLCADAAGAATQLASQGVRPDVAIVDPPRKGCAPEVFAAIDKMGIERLVYVSCDPATLARDLALLATMGYTARRACGVDLFPRTPHVETVVLLSKKENEQT